MSHSELWQLFDEQGRSIGNQGAARQDVYQKALLHGASHVWIWRETDGKPNILLQIRALDKKTWPGHYDISAAGHIDFGEDAVIAAAREVHEEIGVEVNDEDLKLIGVERRFLPVPDTGYIENEFCWLFILKLEDDTNFELTDGEVDSLVWKTIEKIKAELKTDAKYVQHGNLYYETVFRAIQREASK